MTILLLSLNVLTLSDDCSLAWGYIPATGTEEDPSMVPQYTKDNLKSIISLPPDWQGNNTTQMILGVLAHRQRVTSSPVWIDEI